MRFIIQDGVLRKMILDETDTHAAIPDGCIEIGENVFCNNTQIVSVSLPSSVCRIGKDAFSQCSALQEINLEYITEIGESAFAATALRSIQLDSIEVIHPQAFRSCASLQHIELSDRIRKIHSDTFYGCTALESIDLKHVQSIGCRAFDHCTNLKEITLTHVHLIDEAAFSGCTELSRIHSADLFMTEAVSLGSADPLLLFTPDDEHEISFYNPRSNLSAGKYQYFCGCTLPTPLPAEARAALKYLVIPKEVVAISAGAFAGCENLEAVELHDGLDIEAGAFLNCPMLKYLIIPGYNPETCRFIFDEYDDGWRDYAYMDEDGICDYIGETNFRNDWLLQKTAADHKAPEKYFTDSNIRLCTHWIRMNFFAFDDFINLKLCDALDQRVWVKFYCKACRETEQLESKIIWGSRISQSLPEPARADLKYLTIPKDVVKIESGSFAGCSNLEAIELHDGLEVETGAFSNCPQLKYLIIPGYNPDTCLFLYNEYEMDYWRLIFSRDISYENSDDVFSHTGEADFRNNEKMREAIASNNPDAYMKEHDPSESSIVLCTHWIRMNYFTFDDFMSLKICAELPSDR